MDGHQGVAGMADLRIAETGDFENPMTWHRKEKLPRDRLTIDSLFDNVYRKSVTLDQYGVCDHPEYIKWKIFGHNIVICYEYVFNEIPDKALEIIEDIENLLKSIHNNDSFLKSIKMALDHVTFSMKGYILKLCSLETQLDNFVMPINMNNVNRAGLFGIQALFLYYDYGYLCVNQAKDKLLKAISLNDTEAEWYFLIAKIYNDAGMNFNSIQYFKQEFEMSKKAVKIGSKVSHKIHLINSYYRMTKIQKIDKNTRNLYSNIRIKLINETMDNTNDLLLFKSSLKSLSNISDDQANNIIEKLIYKLESSNCGYVHNFIGKYYLDNVQDYEKALFHLKKAVSANSFYGFYDYINTLLKIDGNAVPIEKILVDMLKKFPHPVHQQKILCQIISHNVITKRDTIGALNYVEMLLSMKNITCVKQLQNHKMEFSGKGKRIDLFYVLSEKLNGALNNNTLSTDNMKRATEVLKVFDSFKLFVSNLTKPKVTSFGSKFYNNEPKNLLSKDKKSDVTCENNIHEGNWRSLKPDYNSNSFNFQKQSNRKP